MVSKKLLPLFILFIIVLGACQSKNATSEPGQEYPLPPQGAPIQGQIYPYPAQDAPLEPASTSASLYPDFNDGDEIQWHQAVSLIMDGEVVKVVQADDLKVFISLSDGRTLVTVQPEIDAIVKEIEFCGDVCKETLVTNE